LAGTRQQKFVALFQRNGVGLARQLNMAARRAGSGGPFLKKAEKMLVKSDFATKIPVHEIRIDRQGSFS